MQALAIVLSAFVAGLSLTTASNGMDEIQGYLAFSTEQRLMAQLVATATFLVGLLASPDIERRLGSRRFALSASALFTLCSIAAGFASAYLSLTIPYAARNLMCAGLTCSGLIRLAGRHGSPWRGRLLGLFLCAFLVGSGLGPAASQWLTDVADWRWLFLATAPAGVLTLIAEAAAIEGSPS